jgi:hypothetical protein
MRHGSGYIPFNMLGLFSGRSLGGGVGSCVRVYERRPHSITRTESLLSTQVVSWGLIFAHTLQEQREGGVGRVRGHGRGPQTTSRHTEFLQTTLWSWGLTFLRTS